MLTSSDRLFATLGMPYPVILVTTKRPEPPLDPVYRGGAIESLRHWVCKARKIFKCDIPMPSLSFDLLGRVGGYADYETRHIRLNPMLLAENPDEYHTAIIPHELAHLITRRLYPGEIAPHGPEWQDVMCRLGLPPERTHAMSTANSRVSRHRKMPGFFCGCGERSMGIRKHNSYIKGTTYTCRTCGEVVVGNAEIEAARAAYVRPAPKRRRRR